MIIIYVLAKSSICHLHDDKLESCKLFLLILSIKFQMLSTLHEIKHKGIVQKILSCIQLVFDISISTVSSLSSARFSSFVLFCFLPPPLRFPLLSTPFSSSIMRKICVWSELSIGAIEISRTARNLPQLFKCSFSKRKKFHTNRLKSKENVKKLWKKIK